MLISDSLQKFPAYLYIQSGKKPYFGLAKGDFIHMIFLRISGKTSYWIKVTCGSSKLPSFVSVSWPNCHGDRSRWWMAKEFFYTCWTCLTKCSMWRTLDSFPDSLWHVAARLCPQAGCVPKGYCGCNLTLCHTSDPSSQSTGCFISLFNKVANRHSPNRKVLNTPKCLPWNP